MLASKYLCSKQAKPWHRSQRSWIAFKASTTQAVTASFPVAREKADTRREVMSEESDEVEGSVKSVTVEVLSESAMAMAEVGDEPFLSFNHF